MITAEPETASWVHVILAFSVVIVLLAGLAFGLKLIKTRGLVLPGLNNGARRRLQIVETLPLDLRRRLMIVRCDGAEHLLLLGNEQDIVIESRLNENRPSGLSTKSMT